MQFTPLTSHFTMAIYQVCKTVITGTLVASATLLATGCSSHQMGTESVATPNASENRAHAEGAHTDAEHTEHAHKGVNTNHDIYHSKTIEVPAGKPVPALTVRVDEDSVRGWNLYVGTANFDFTPEEVGGESSASAGHAHLYINDQPGPRIYNTWTHLPALPPGTNEVRVTLNANGHETLTTQGEPIEESVTVDVYNPNAN